MHSAIAVANELMKTARRKEMDDSFTPMQLLKLVYLCHAWMLGLYGRPMLKESVLAWRYGPVIRSLYDVICVYKDKPVPYPIKTHLFGGSNEDVFTSEESDVIEQVCEQYGKYDGITLSRMTHKKDSPWFVTWHSNGQNSSISNDLIEHFYKAKYAQSQKVQAA